MLLRDQEWISAKSFTCNAWDGCWTNSQSDQLAEWALSLPASHDPGASLGGPTAKLRRAADIVVGSQQALTDSGVPVAVAFRAMAAAIHAISNSRGRSDLVQQWPADHLAFAFLTGALKCEWSSAHHKANCTSLQGCFCGLRARMRGPKGEPHAVALACDMVFCDGGLDASGSVSPDSDDELGALCSRASSTQETTATSCGKTSPCSWEESTAMSCGETI